VGDAIQTYPYDLESAIDDRTAGVAFFLQAAMLDASLSLEQTIAIAHRHGVPVIVDAAAELPPKSNLWAIAGQGADLVIFSGGKDIGGPQSSGLIVGGRDLVEAAFLQSAPYELVVARSMKAGKETVAGLLAALEEYLQEDEVARFEEWERIAAFLLAGINRIPGLAAERWQPSQPKIQPCCVPRLTVRLQPGLSLSLPELVGELRHGDPPIAVERSSSVFFVNTQTLCFEEAGVILKRLSEILKN
jgi:seryl-tRNA(Sec) selenium transferase